MLLIAIAASTLPLLSAYSLCNPADVKGPINIPLQNVLVTSPIVANGNIQIIDGCTFAVDGFSLQNAGTAKWFGGVGSSVDGITIADDVINPNPSGGKQQFTFRSVAGAAVSFRDFNQFRLFDTQTNTLIAVANVPANVMASGPTVTGGPVTGTVAISTATSNLRPMSTMTSKASPSAQASSAESSLTASSGIMAFLMLFMGF